MRLIDADALIEVIENERAYLINRGLNGMENAIVHHILPLIDDAPTIDAEPVVYCKDCEHWSEEYHGCDIRDSFGWDYKPDDFCSYGERREP